MYISYDRVLPRSNVLARGMRDNHGRCLCSADQGLEAACLVQLASFEHPRTGSLVLLQQGGFRPIDAIDLILHLLPIKS